MTHDSNSAAIAYLMGNLAAVHEALGLLEGRGVEGLDPARCDLESAFGVLREALTGVSSVEAIAGTL